MCKGAFMGGMSTKGGTGTRLVSPAGGFKNNNWMSSVLGFTTPI